MAESLSEAFAELRAMWEMSAEEADQSEATAEQGPAQGEVMTRLRPMSVYQIAPQVERDRQLTLIDVERHTEGREPGYIHEAMDRSQVFMDMLGDHLLEHPAVVCDPQAFRWAHDAHQALFNLYQHLGAYWAVADETVD